MIHFLPQRRFLLALLAGVSSFFFASQAWADSVPSVHVDWASFLGRQDLIWSRNPCSWGDSLFIGNGNLGATVYVQEKALGWEINQEDVTHDTSRYPIGRLVLKTEGVIKSGTARLVLWDAEGRGTVVTDKGSIHWRTFTATTPSVIVIELQGAEGEEGCELDWQPAKARPPRKAFRKEPFAPEDLHPDAVVTQTAQGITSVQTFLNGGAHAESILHVEQPGGKRLYYISIGSGTTGSDALAQAQAATASAAQIGLDQVTQTHRAWWHSYYPASFLSVPNGSLEAFYWIQIYKLGSAMRADGPILDLMGPWFAPSQWCRIWWNLNIQLAYSPLFAANRLDLAESLFGALDRHRKQLLDNVPPDLRSQAAAISTNSGYDLVSPVNAARNIQNGRGAEMGNLPWVLFLYHLYYTYQMDDSILRDRVLPLLKPTIGHYLAFVQKGEDGYWHLPLSYSPELASVPDCNYDLALLRWGLQTLVESSEHLHIDDPMLPRWRDVLANLTPFPSDASGLMIGRGLPLQESHRHYSHLLAIYPLHLLTPDTPADRALIETSVKNWESRTEHLAGYSYTGAASMHAILGDGAIALERLKYFIGHYIKSNTLYTEAGTAPVIETPLSAATSIQEMLLQSWGGILRIYPAVPAAWADASFEHLRGEGAFLVSAVRSGGRTSWVRIESLAGAPCRICIRDWDNAVIHVSSTSAAHLKVDRPGNFTLNLPKGASVILTEKPLSSLPALTPVTEDPAAQNPYPMHYR